MLFTIFSKSTDYVWSPNSRALTEKAGSEDEEIAKKSQGNRGETPRKRLRVTASNLRLFQLPSLKLFILAIG